MLNIGIEVKTIRYTCTPHSTLAYLVTYYYLLYIISLNGNFLIVAGGRE